MNSTTYRVVKGDTLSEIALRHEVPMEKLVQLNHIENVHLLWIGQKLRIPAPDPSPSRFSPHEQDAPPARQEAPPPRRAAPPVEQAPKPKEPTPKPAPTPKSPASASAQPQTTGSLSAEAPAEVLRQLEKREGSIEGHQQVYIDTEGYATAGLGHKLTDRERLLYKVGAKVPLSLLKNWARNDVKKAYAAALFQAAKAKQNHQTLVNALTCVNFQLGTSWYLEHKQTWAHIMAHRWDEAAREATDSKWYRQTPQRVEDFQAALKAMKGASTQAGPAKAAEPHASDLEAIARAVHEAMSTLNTDEQTVYTQLARLKHDSTRIQQLKALYKKTYRVDLVEHIKENFSNTWLFGDELNQALSYLVARAPAKKSPKKETHDPGAGAKQVMGYIKGEASTITVVPVGGGQYLRADAARNFLALQKKAREAGFTLTATSGFRSMDKQRELYAMYLKGTGNLAAKPGYSNHQGGVSMDIGGIGGFKTSAYRWMSQHADEFGFVNDVKKEHWHWTYKGVDVS